MPISWSCIRRERSEILQAAKAEARELVAEANRRIEQTIKEIREAQAEREMTRLIRRDLDDFRERVERADAADAEKAARIEREMEKLQRRRQRREERRSQPAAAAAAAPVAPPQREVEVGVKVVLEGQQTPGVVQALKGDKVQVAFGQLLTTVDRKRLRVVSNNEYREATRPVSGAHGGVGRRGGAQTQFQGSYRRARDARRGGGRRRADLHRRCTDGGHRFGDDSPRQGHGGAQGGDTPLPGARCRALRASPTNMPTAAARASRW